MYVCTIDLYPELCVTCIHKLCAQKCVRRSRLYTIPRNMYNECTLQVGGSVEQTNLCFLESLVTQHTKVNVLMANYLPGKSHYSPG